VGALKKESETLQSATGFFLPLMKRFDICFFWEMEKTSLKLFGRDFIVPTDSAAPFYDDTERGGIPANHSKMVKFDDPVSPSFMMVVMVITRYSVRALDLQKERMAEAEEKLALEHRKNLSAALRLIRG
jgi:hypothetical protein